MQIVMCRGVFDMLHVAHVRHLKEAKSMGDYLVVSLTPDEVVKREKRTPIVPQAERMEMLLSLRCVDVVDLCDSFQKSLEKYKPDIYCKGSDHQMTDIEKEYCKKHKINIFQTQPNPQSTTKLIEKCKKCKSS